jgi:hypothetical protein
MATAPRKSAKLGQKNLICTAFSKGIFNGTLLIVETCHVLHPDDIGHDVRNIMADDGWRFVGNVDPTNLQYIVQYRPDTLLYAYREMVMQVGAFTPEPLHQYRRRDNIAGLRDAFTMLVTAIVKPDFPAEFVHLMC